MPRRPRLDSGAAIVAMVGAMFAVIGGVLATVFCWSLPTDWGIERRGLEVVGEVVCAERAEGHRINRRPATRIEYRYVVDGVAHDDDLLTMDGPLVAATRQPGARVALTLVFPLFGAGLLVAAAVVALRGRAG